MGLYVPPLESHRAPVAPVVSTLRSPASLETPGIAVIGNPARAGRPFTEWPSHSASPCARDIRTSLYSTGRQGQGPTGAHGAGNPNQPNLNLNLKLKT